MESGKKHTIGGCDIDARNLKTLSGREWLNDEIINGYMHLLKERANPPGAPMKIMMFNSMFRKNLREKGYAGVARWSRRQGAADAAILKLDGIVVPVNNGYHWTLAYINIKARRLEYYDSLAGAWSPVSELREYLKGELKDLYVASEWSDSNPAGATSPIQENGYDCGVFLCKTAEVLTRGGNLDFVQRDIPTIRRIMQLDLIKGRLDW